MTGYRRSMISGSVMRVLVMLKDANGEKNLKRASTRDSLSVHTTFACPSRPSSRATYDEKTSATL